MTGFYIYPRLSDRDYGFVRIGGAGLANNMFVVARAVILAKKLKAPILRPTWEKFSLGPFLRREQDKRCYCGIFCKDELADWKKLLLLKTLPMITENDINEHLQIRKAIIEVSGLGHYFEDLFDSVDLIQQYFNSAILPSAVADVPPKPINAVAIHVRLGDFNSEMRVSLNWYREIILQLQSAARRPLEFHLFSDGKSDELTPLLNITGVKRVFYGNALADIIAISRSQLVIGSDSTFSGWGVFLGQVPAIFNRCHYGRTLRRQEDGLLTGDTTELPAAFLATLRARDII